MLLGVNVAIFKDGKVLLTRREDFRVWCLPGGSVDPNETVAQAGIREVREETGLEVELVRMVGIYSRPGWHDGGYHIVVFAAAQIGGEMQPAPREVIEMGWFAPDELPARLLIGQRGRILDAASGLGGSVAVSESAKYPHRIPSARFQLYAHRDASGLARDDFYWQTFGGLDNAPSEVEVKGFKIDRQG